MASKVPSQVQQSPAPTVQRQAASVPRECMCGCGVSFTPLRSNHWFIEDHRFVSYQSHACPDCGSQHRIAVKRGSVGDDPRDSSIDVVREQRQ